MQPIFAIVWLTWKAAFRYRLFRVIVTLLLGAVVGLPLLIKHDGTAAGFAQILLTYTLGAVTTLLGFCTLWLACGTLARDVEDCQIQMVVVKPVARWQVWLGKWLGLVSLNAALLAVAGLSIYGGMEWRARKLAPAELSRLRNEVLVARGSARQQGVDQIIVNEARARLQDLKSKDKLGQADENKVFLKLVDQVRTELQLVPPNGVRNWTIKLGAAKNRLKGQPLFLRVKFNTAQVTSSQYETFDADWVIGEPKKTELWGIQRNLAPDTFDEFEIAPDLFDADGNLYIQFHNPNNTALIFTLDEGLEVLYREGGFALNFARGLGIILCWMALLAALGLAAASFLSFPVAAFCCLAVLTMVFSSGTLTTVVTEGTVLGTDEDNASVRVYSALDDVVVPAFRAALKVINLVRQFSPVDSLSTGRNVAWGELGLAFAEVVLLLGGILAAFGIFVFTRRELATAQGNH
jgi:hypothetical protein